MENTSSTTINARYNWWGNASGPTHLSNPNGTGEGVSDYVDFGHYLGASAVNPVSVIALTPIDRITFGEAVVNSTPVIRTLTITNTGTAAS